MIDDRIKIMLEQYPAEMPLENKLREILQQTALLGLSRHHFFEHAIFYGGTALRILYGLNRFSEDLDFSLLEPNSSFNFNPFLEGMIRELHGLGFQLEISEKEKNNNKGIQSAFLKANTLNLILSFQEKIPKLNKEKKIQIKLEIDTTPPYKPAAESKLITTPFPFYVGTYRLEDLFAGKMHAVLCRDWKNNVKGRDWYDLIWYIQNKTAVHLEHLKARMVQTGHWEAQLPFGTEELQGELAKKIDAIDWKIAKKDIEPFIPNRHELDIWSAQFFHDLVPIIKTFSSI